MYKIKRLADGLYSRGGMWGGFSKTGKVWNTLGGLKLHLNQFLHRPNYTPRDEHYRDCIVIMYDDVNGGIKENVLDIHEYLLQKQQEHIERDEQKKIKRDMYEAELKNLKKKYGR